MDKFKNPSIKRKVLWLEVTNELNFMGYSFTPKQVEGRWKTLLSSYRRGKDLNRQTGKDRKSIEFEDALDDILLDRHDTTPVYTLSSSSNSQSEEPDSDHGSTPSCQREEGDSDSGEPPKKACKTKERRESSATQVINFLKVFQDQEEKREKERLETAKQMHNEKVSLFSKLIDVLKNQQ